MSRPSPYHLDPGEAPVCAAGWKLGAHADRSVVFQACDAGEARLFREGPELHDPSGSAAVLILQPRPESIHAHRLRMFNLLLHKGLFFHGLLCFLACW